MSKHWTEIPRDDPALVEHYGDILKMFPDAQFSRDQIGTIRFRPRPLACWLMERINLDRLWCAWLNKEFSRDEMFKFYMDNGYSVCGFTELFAEYLDEMEAEGK